MEIVFKNRTITKNVYKTLRRFIRSWEHENRQKLREAIETAIIYGQAVVEQDEYGDIVKVTPECPDKGIDYERISKYFG